MTYKLSKREIKFRAWDKKRKKMIFLKKLLPALEDRYILMQYTGLKDKKGKEIYEGDIVRWANGIGVIVWNRHYGMWDCLYISGEELPDGNLGVWTNGVGGDSLRLLEIIGNIFQNPELLTQTYEQKR